MNEFGGTGVRSGLIGDCSPARRARTWLGTSLAALLIFATLAPAIAHAETVGLDGATLTITAAPGEANVLLVEPVGPSGYLVSDDGAPITAGIGCGVAATPGAATASPKPHAAECTGPVAAVRIDAGDGDDLIGAWDVPIGVQASGAAGDDLIVTGAGSDQATGDDGLDTLETGAGDDRLSGGDGGDLLTGGPGADTLLGGNGDDIEQGGAGSGDVVSGGDGADLVTGGPGNDVVNGDGGDDALSAGGGRDTIATGTGTDAVYLAPDSTSTVDCRPGDMVRAPGAVPPEGCGRLPARRRMPVAWPPSPPATTVARAAAIRPSTDDVAVKAWLRGDVRRIAVKVRRPNSKPAIVRVRAYDRRHHRLRQFRRTVRTRDWGEFPGPPPPRSTWIVRVDCCVG